MPDTATPTAPHLFTTRQAVDHELTATGTWKALHAAVHASAPSLTSHAHHNRGSEPVCGLRFTEDTPHTGQARTRGTVVITPDGILTVRAYTIAGQRWLTALRHLGTLHPHPHSIRPGAPTTAPTTAPTDPATPSWSLRPHVKNRSFSGHLQPADHVHAKTLTELPDTIGDVNAMLTVAPATEPRAPSAGCSPSASSTCWPPAPPPARSPDHRPRPTGHAFRPRPRTHPGRGRPTPLRTRTGSPHPPARPGPPCPVLRPAPDQGGP
ncbi:hypothetical protein [Streptomyces agglomeratus]|uniref:hypothetical protein n=1 Tax=Streptomyces agglomeratus TaxID=285458 RepID=UPI000854EA72|nr:hypothetical protein [Streptomyces agglomeratus]OEJ49524.1 hypothetical protein BGK72_00520 [Streptomyces agglomeratus]